MRKLAILAIAMLSVVDAHAGGSSYPTTIESMERVKADHYRLVVKTRALSSEPQRIVLHLKFRPRALGLRPPPMVTRAAYDECIALFKTHLQERKSFPLGVMGTGLVPLPDKPNEYQSNALALLEEFRGDRVCYSFAMPT